MPASYLECHLTQQASVLVVDDDPKVSALLRNVLEDDGFAVLKAETAA